MWSIAKAVSYETPIWRSNSDAECPRLLVTMSHAAVSHAHSGTFVFVMTVPAVTETQYPHVAHSTCLRFSRLYAWGCPHFGHLKSSGQRESRTNS